MGGRGLSQGAAGRWGVGLGGGEGVSAHVPAWRMLLPTPSSHPVGISVTKGQSDKWEDRLYTDEGAAEKEAVNRVGGREGVGKQSGRDRQTGRQTGREIQGRRDRGREERTDGEEGREGGQPPGPGRVPSPAPSSPVLVPLS